jgi:site-specific recombinase XerD
LLPALLVAMPDTETAQGVRDLAILAVMLKTDLRGLVTGYMKAAGVVGNKSTHSLRHTAITKAVSSGQPLERVMTMAGHANPATTMIYYHVEAHINYDD